MIHINIGPVDILDNFDRQAQRTHQYLINHQNNYGTADFLMAQRNVW